MQFTPECQEIAEGSGDRYLNHLYTNKKWHVKQERIQKGQKGQGTGTLILFK